MITISNAGFVLGARNLYKNGDITLEQYAEVLRRYKENGKS